MPLLTILRGYRIYFTSQCTNEGIAHVHADIYSKTSTSAAKLWVHADGSSTVAYNKSVSLKIINEIRVWISNNHIVILSEYLKMNSNTRYKDI